MPIKLLKGINVAVDDEGKLSLVDPKHHGCALFDVEGSQHFELQLTAEQDDSWVCKAGAYCVGIMDAEDVPLVHPYDGYRGQNQAWNAWSSWDAVSWDARDEDDDSHEACAAYHMTASVSSIYTLSTGSFIFSNGIFRPERENRIFDGFLKRDQTLVMRYRHGRLGYRLDPQQSVVDLTGKMEQLKARRPTWGSIRAKGSGKGEGKTIPCLWVFAQEGPEDMYASNTVKLRLTIPERNYQFCASDDPCPLAKKMDFFWEDKLFCDCTIECAGERLGAHRIILCAASPVFNAAFAGSLREATEARFEIRNCDQPAAAKAMLEFMYRGRLSDLTLRTLIALLPLAVQYQIEELCSIAAGKLINQVTEETIREIAQVLKQFRHQPSIAWAYAELLGILKSDDRLLSAVV